MGRGPGILGSVGIGIDFRIDPGVDRSGLEFNPPWNHRGGRLAGFGMDVSKPRHFHFTGSTVDRPGVQLLHPYVFQVLAGGAKG
jgi:hypothetical protein